MKVRAFASQPRAFFISSSYADKMKVFFFFMFVYHQSCIILQGHEHYIFPLQIKVYCEPLCKPHFHFKALT